MAHYVGKELHIRPSEILDNWGVPELIVAYGEFVNEIAQQNYETWKNQDYRYRGEPPKRRFVHFVGMSDLEEE